MIPDRVLEALRSEVSWLVHGGVRPDRLPFEAEVLARRVLRSAGYPGFRVKAQVIRGVLDLTLTPPPGVPRVKAVRLRI